MTIPCCRTHDVVVDAVKLRVELSVQAGLAGVLVGKASVSSRYLVGLVRTCPSPPTKRSQKTTCVGVPSELDYLLVNHDRARIDSVQVHQDTFSADLMSGLAKLVLQSFSFNFHQLHCIA